MLSLLFRVPRPLTAGFYLLLSAATLPAATPAPARGEVVPGPKAAANTTASAASPAATSRPRLGVAWARSIAAHPRGRRLVTGDRRGPADCHITGTGR